MLLECGHRQESGRSSASVCEHLQRNGKAQPHYRWVINGVNEVHLVCSDCARLVDRHIADFPTHLVCYVCFLEYIKGNLLGYVGQPVTERSTSLRFAHRSVTLAQPLQNILDIQPFEHEQENSWLALTANGQLSKLELTNSEGRSSVMVSLSETTLAWIVEEVENPNFNYTYWKPEHQIRLVISPDGQFVVIVNRFGLHGVVLDLSSGRIMRHLERGRRYAELCDFPVAISRYSGRLLLIHGTDWNRLDISNLTTGELLTTRISPLYDRTQPEAHYLDYFHANLAVSPDAEWIADNGWIWGSASLTTTWSLKNWLESNVWESDDGSSRRKLFNREHRDDPLCWIDARMLAIWGYAEDEDVERPVLRIFDVVSGERKREFSLPEGALFFDTYLFSCSPHRGTAIWDMETGERLHLDPDFHPARYHRATRQFLTLLDEKTFLLSDLED